MSLILRKVCNGFEAPNVNLSLVLVVLVLSGAAAFFFGLRTLYLPVFAITIIWYGITSRRAAHSNRDAANATLAAEQIVAIGVASLIFHVALAGFNLRTTWLATQSFSGDAVWIAAESFGEGLICATCAPLVAMWVRSLHYDDRRSGHDADRSDRDSAVGTLPNADIETATGQVANATTLIASQIAQYGTALKNLIGATIEFSDQVRTSTTSAAESIEALTNTVNTQTHSLSTGMATIAKELEGRAETLREAIDKLTRDIGGIAQPITDSFGSVADDVRNGGRRLQRGLEDATADIRASVQKLAQDVSGVAQPIADSFGSVADDVRNGGRTIQRGLDDAASDIRTSVEKLAKDVSGIAQPIADSFVSVADDVRNGGQTLQRGLDAAASDIRASVEKLTRDVSGIAQPIADSFGSIADDVRKGGQTLQRGLDDAASDVRTSGKILSDDFRIIAASIAEYGRSISRSLGTLVEDVDRRVVAIGQSADSLAQRLMSLEAGLSTVENSVLKVAADLPSTFDVAAVAVANLKSEMAGLGNKLGEGAILLQGLQDLINAVRRFIPADAEQASAVGRHAP